MKYFLFFLLIFSALFSITPVSAGPNCSKDEECPGTYCKTEDNYCAISKLKDGKVCAKDIQCQSGKCIFQLVGADPAGVPISVGSCALSAPPPAPIKSWAPIAPKLEIKIPTLQPFTTEGMTQPDAEGNIYVPFLGQYIVGIYKWLVLVAGIIATVMIIWGGFLYLTSGGNAQQAGQGKERITSALLGLFLLLGSYLLLYIINPDLVKFKSLKINIIKAIDLEDIVGNQSDAGAAVDGVSASCAPESDLQKVDKLVAVGGGAAKNPFLLPDVAEAIKKAEEIAKQKGRQLLVVSAHRTLPYQQQLWNKALQKHGNETIAKKFTAKPTCNAPHITGRAVDICLKGSGTCSKIKSEYANFSNDDVILLQTIMKEAGFKRYCAEWWHFEYNLNAPSNRCSP